MKLSDALTTLKGVGPEKAESFRARGIETLEDLIQFFPRSYEDRRKAVPIAELKPGKAALVEAVVLSRRYSGNPYKKHTPVSFLATDDSGTIEIVYFNGRYMANACQINQRYTFYGKVSLNMGRLQMIHPESVRTGSPEDIRGVLPIYPQIPGVSQKEMRRVQTAVSELIPEIKEWLPEEVVQKYRLAGPAYALQNIHFPKNRSSVLMSRFRLVFEELLTLETGLLYIRSGSVREGEGVSIDPEPGDRFIETLPFQLTSGQKRVWEEIAKDLKAPKAMNRLVQGDVGSGKTAVAEIAMTATVRSGYQAVMMAPTEILAEQHFRSLTRDLGPHGIRVGLLCASLSAAEKKQVYQDLAEGRIDVLAATHAVLQPGVEFRALGLVITDEQHRFGVEQRHRLTEKGDNPNVLVMTATPIPRTLAVVLYGELDISVIDTMPASRKPILTYSAGAEDRDRVYRAVGKELDAGHQAYIVAPLIEESDKIEAKSAEELYKETCKRFPNHRIALIHGAQKQEEKEQTMKEFAEGRIDALVSTVVIEVGIDVANATVMVIENCERFGLAQMHQLRGRVGRGAAQSYCYLILDHETEIAQQRVKILCESNDGFKIAEEDMRLRGPGEIFGTRQHGLPEMHISDIIRHSDVLEKARLAASDILKKDPALALPESAELRHRVERMFGEDIRLEL